jgi:zinc protease
LLALPAGVLAALAAGFVVAAVPAGFVSETLPNGLRVSILPDASLPVVATQVWYHVGSANEDEGSRGLAHLFEHLMFGETTTRSSEDYSDFHHRFGGEENAYTSGDETVYWSEIAPEHHLGVLEREADRMRNLVIDDKNLENEKRIVTEELRVSTENDPQSRLMVEATRRLMGTHPYALWPTGTKEDIARATVESCRSFYDRYYRPNNAHLVVVGPVDAPAVLADVRRLFGPIEPGGTTPPDVPALDTWTFPSEIELEEDLPPAEVAVLGFPLPPPGSPHADALDVLGELLSGGHVDRFEEILVQRRGKAIAAGTEFLDYRRGGGILFYSASLPYRRKATAYRLMDETLAEISRLDWLTEEAVESAKRSIVRGEASGAYSAASRAEDLGTARWWNGDEGRAFDYIARIRAVSPESVRAAYRKYLAEGRPIRMYVRPEHVPWYVTMFGWLYPVFGP